MKHGEEEKKFHIHIFFYIVATINRFILRYEYSLVYINNQSIYFVF